MKQRVVVCFLALLLLAPLILLASEEKIELRGIAINTSGQVFYYEEDDYDEKAQLASLPEDSGYLMQDAHLANLALFDSKQGEITVALKHRGLFKLSEWGEQAKKTTPVLKRPVIYDKESLREITGASLDKSIVLHKHNILYFDKAKNQYIELKHDISSGKMLTAAARRGNTIYIGTSVNGMYVSRNFSDSNASKGRKIKFSNKYKGLPYISHDKRVALFEEIQAIHIDQKDNIYVGTVNNGGVYFKAAASRTFKRLAWPIENTAMTDVFFISSSGDAGTAWFSTSRGLVIYNRKEDAFSRVEYKKLAPPVENHALSLLRSTQDNTLVAMWRSRNHIINSKNTGLRKKAEGKRMLYSSGLNYRTKKKRNIERMLKNKIYNGVVVDVKDDFGAIRYHSKVPFVKKIRALRPTYNLPELVKFAHSQGAIVVARVVVMKDRSLYRTPGYAILDQRTKKPWVGNPDEHWIDPYNPDLAKNYYIPLLKELEALGVDEIQLDYIRFPSDGATWRNYYRYKKGDMYKSEALENFLYQLQQSVNIPLGVDVYGYHGIYRASGTIGQDMSAFGPYVDVVSPMVYSSHFGPRYLTSGPRSERAYKLLNHCAKRSLHIAAGRYVVRPYLQAFPMRNHIWGYGTKYFQDQVKGGLDEGIRGFIFWGAINHMKRVEKALEPLNLHVTDPGNSN